jgi:hypothetical protein
MTSFGELNLMTIGVTAATCALCTIQRLTMCWRVPRAFDSWAHLAFAIVAKRQKSGIFGPISLSPGHSLHYPLLAHRALGLLPERLLLRHAGVINVFIESAFLLVFLLMVSNPASPRVAMLTGLLYVLTPMLFSKVTTGTSSHFSPRLYSEMMGNLVAVSVWGPAHAAQPVQWGITTGGVCYLLMSSKFGTQVCFFLFLPAMMLSRRWDLVACVMTSVLICLALSGGQFARAIREQLSHLHWYWKRGRFSSGVVAARSHWQELANAFKIPAWRERTVQLALAIGARNPWTAIILKMPIVPVLATSAILSPAIWRESGLTECLPILVVAFVVFAATTFGPMRVFGEPERYLTHCSFLISYAAVVVITALPHSSLVMISVLAWGSLYWFAELVLLGFLRLNAPRHDEDGAIRTLRNATVSGEVVLAYPHHVLPFGRILLESEAIPIFPVFGIGGPKEQLLEREDYPHMDLAHLAWLREQCALRCIVAKRSELADVDHEALSADGWIPVDLPWPDGIGAYRHGPSDMAQVAESRIQATS